MEERIQWLGEVMRSFWFVHPVWSLLIGVVLLLLLGLWNRRLDSQIAWLRYAEKHGWRQGSDGLWRKAQ